MDGVYVVIEMVFVSDAFGDRALRPIVGAGGCVLVELILTG